MEDVHSGDSGIGPAGDSKLVHFLFQALQVARSGFSLLAGCLKWIFTSSRVVEVDFHFYQAARSP